MLNMNKSFAHHSGAARSIVHWVLYSMAKLRKKAVESTWNGPGEH